MRKKGFTKFVLASLAIILAGTISWAFYAILNQGIEDGLGSFGVNNIYLQGGIIIFIGMVILFLIGWKGKKIWNSVLGK